MSLLNLSTLRLLKNKVIYNQAKFKHLVLRGLVKGSQYGGSKEAEDRKEQDRSFVKNINKEIEVARAITRSRLFRGKPEATLLPDFDTARTALDNKLQSTGNRLPLPDSVKADLTDLLEELVKLRWAVGIQRSVDWDEALRMVPDNIEQNRHSKTTVSWLRDLEARILADNVMRDGFEKDLLKAARLSDREQLQKMYDYREPPLIGKTVNDLYGEMLKEHFENAAGESEEEKNEQEYRAAQYAAQNPPPSPIKARPRIPKQIPLLAYPPQRWDFAFEKDYEKRFTRWKKKEEENWQKKFFRMVKRNKLYVKKNYFNVKKEEHRQKALAQLREAKLDAWPGRLSDKHDAMKFSKTRQVRQRKELLMKFAKAQDGATAALVNVQPAREKYRLKQPLTLQQLRTEVNNINDLYEVRPDTPPPTPPDSDDGGDDDGGDGGFPPPPATSDEDEPLYKKYYPRKWRKHEIDKAAKAKVIRKRKASFRKKYQGYVKAKKKRRIRG